ncbi:MFS transporter [Terrimonas pollutisoli]|uniref:MFS transporter n=1 Tax=Terrimonas pollutisoli TaxID=3034147 RepID=UPI0023EC1CAB|nr:MFS transporter [Terrimonas sp. H1YJ31]
MQAVNRNQLFLASCIALIFTSLTFAFRASLEGVWGAEFNLTKEQVGWIFSPAFWGFTLAMVIGGPLCDVLGMKRLLVFAFIGHIAGAIIYIIAKDATMLFIGTLCIGIGNGMVEAACNPLVVSLYPNNKTTMLNRFHVWFPGGNVIGGLLAFVVLTQLNLDWRILLVPLFIAVAIYGFLFFKLKFPQTERVTTGVSTKEMFAACLNPLFLIMLACMFLTAATELGTTTWILALLEGSGVSGILVLVFIFGIMALGRSFAGPVVHRLNPNGMLIFSALFAGIGLLLLSQSSGYAAFGAAAVFAIGICFFWPTMLGFVSEYVPKSGALGLSLMGGAGMFSVSLILPVMGKWLDEAKAKAIAEGIDPSRAEAIAGSETFMKVAIMPAILLVIFTIIYFVRKSKLKPAVA